MNQMHTFERSWPAYIPITNATQHSWSCELFLRHRVISKLTCSSYLNTFNKSNLKVRILRPFFPGASIFRCLD